MLHVNLLRWSIVIISRHVCCRTLCRVPPHEPLTSVGLWSLFPALVHVCLLQDVKVSSAPLMLLRIPSLKLRVRGRKEAFEANLKTEAELWNLMVKEMRAGRSMADLHKVRGLLVGGGGNDGTEGIASILVVSVGSRTHTGITEEGVV